MTLSEALNLATNYENDLILWSHKDGSTEHQWLAKTDGTLEYRSRSYTDGQPMSETFSTTTAIDDQTLTTDQENFFIERIGLRCIGNYNRYNLEKTITMNGVTFSYVY